MAYPVGFVIFGCLTIPKYRQQVEDCWNTWCQDAIKAKCIVRFYVGDIPEDLDPTLKQVCVNVHQGDSYMSATFKQWRGLEEMSERPCKWVFTAGTDTFVHVKNALEFVSKYSEKELITIGGGLGSEMVGDQKVSYFSGGAGIFLSKMLLDVILLDLPEFMPQWISSTMGPNIIHHEDISLLEFKYIIAASDLQLGVLCQEQDALWISLPDRMFGSKTYNGEGVNKDTLISCHHMKHDDFYAYHSYLCGAS